MFYTFSRQNSEILTYRMPFTINRRKVINSQKQSEFFGPPCNESWQDLVQ